MGKYHTHKLYAILAKVLNIRKQVARNLVNESLYLPIQSPDRGAERLYASICR